MIDEDRFTALGLPFLSQSKTPHDMPCTDLGSSVRPYNQNSRHHNVFEGYYSVQSASCCLSGKLSGVDAPGLKRDKLDEVFTGEVLE